LGVSHSARSRVLVVTHEPLRQNLSGPGIRALEMGRALSERHAVTVATPFPPEITDARCTFAGYSVDRPASMYTLAEQADVVVLQGYTLANFPLLATLNVPLVVDLYCPFTIEHLEMLTSRPDQTDGDIQAGDAAVSNVLAVQNMQLAVGDFFICASERQRDFWLGGLQTANRINLRTYRADPTLRTLIDVVPFGLPEGLQDHQPDGRMPQGAEANVLKGVRPGFHADDHVLLWGGSILDWQDPQTLVRAVASLAARRDDVKLFFMGTRHPNPQVAPMRAVPETIALARELGVLDTQVFFNDWVPYADRWRYLKEADLGCSTHRQHLETRLSFRTRMLDYVWAGLPIVCSDGDVFASLVAERGLGIVVPPGDVDALATGIERLLDDKDERMRCRERLLETAVEFRWRQVVAPLARFCDAPRFAADRQFARSSRAWTRRRFRLTNWAKRTILSTGISRRRIEQLKRFPPVRLLMNWHYRALFSQSTQTERRADGGGSSGRSS
jgi:hypothetical protein